MSEKLSAVKTARREKILDAGEQVFRHYGFRAATMELIAQTSAMSKVTLYGYFRDKDAVFLAVADRLAQKLEAAVYDALTRKGSLSSRVSAALQAKQDIVQAIVRSSAFSVELFANSNLIAGKIFSALDAKIISHLCAILVEEKISEPDETARLLFAASLGIGDHVQNATDAKRDIDRLVSAFL